MVIRLNSNINEFLKDNQEKFDSGNFNANFVNQIYNYSDINLSKQSKDAEYLEPFTLTNFVKFKSKHAIGSDNPSGKFTPLVAFN